MEKKMKVKEIRKKYEPDDINVVETLSPRSGDRLHSPNRLSKMYEKDYVTTDSLDDVIWKYDLDEKINFLIGSTSERNLLVKNIKLRFEEV